MENKYKFIWSKISRLGNKGEINGGDNGKKNKNLCGPRHAKRGNKYGK